MKKEYDFSKGIRGKFYRSNGKINLPIYLDPENYDFVEKIAQKKNQDITVIVNKLIKSDKDLARAIG